jgi:Predicted nucleoside-diphosphate-sugar epimerases
MIVLTTPTGLIGHQVLRNVLDKGEPIRVILRDASRLPADIVKRVEVIQGSHADPAVVKKAFRGADAVFWLVPPDPKAASVEAAYVDFSRPACEAFRSEGIKHVVGISSIGRGKVQAKHAGNITASLAMDDLIAATGVHYRVLANSAFMDNILRQAATIKAHAVFTSPNPGDLKGATCATRDIASIAAQLLMDRSWSGFGEVPVLGPEDLSFNEMAQIISDVLGRPVRFEEMSLDALKSGLLGRGRSEAMAQAMIDMMMAVNEGIYSDEVRNPESNRLTSFRRWCEEVLSPAVLG